MSEPTGNKKNRLHNKVEHYIINPFISQFGRKAGLHNIPQDIPEECSLIPRSEFTFANGSRYSTLIKPTKLTIRNTKSASVATLRKFYADSFFLLEIAPTKTST